MSSKHGFFRIFLTVLLIVLLVSCSKVEKGTKTSSSDNVDLPDMVLANSSYTFGEKGRRPVTMEAQKITIYNGKNSKTILENIRFFQEETDENGNIVVELSGSCDSAVVSENNSLATLSGNIKLYKKTDNFTISCDKLIWDDNDQKISSDSFVDVVYEDGTHIKAEDFSALLNDNVYEFGRIIEGRFESED